jgi:hypothetical protein
VKSVCRRVHGSAVNRGGGLGVERVGGLDHDEGRAGDQVMRLEQAVDRSLGDKVALLLGEAHRQLARRQFRLSQGQVDDAPALRVGDAVPDPVGPRRLVLQRLWAIGLIQIAPPVERGGWDTKVAQCLADRQMGLLDQADDLELLGSRVPHARSSPAPVMLFF